jgi:AcrR family transcriptional regulator
VKKRSDPPAPGSTRDRLLLATERLVATQGVDGVSTRQISTEAGVDLGAIHHHFGSKDRLMLAVRERRAAMVYAAMVSLLEARRAKGGEIGARDLAELIVKPFGDLVLHGGEAKYYPGFLRSATQCPRIAGLMAFDTEWALRILEVFAEIRPDLTPDERRRRLGFMVVMTINAVGDGPVYTWLEATAPGQARHLLGSLQACVAAVLEAP